MSASGRREVTVDDYVRRAREGDAVAAEILLRLIAFRAWQSADPLNGYLADAFEAILDGGVDAREALGIKRPAHRSADPRVRDRNRLLAVTVEAALVEGMTQEQAFGAVAALMADSGEKASESTVRDAFRAWRADRKLPTSLS